MTLRIQRAEKIHAADLLELQIHAYQSEAEIYQDWTIDPLVETFEEMCTTFDTHIVLMAKMGEQLAGSVRARLHEGACEIGRVFVAPDFQGRGIGRSLMASIEREFKHATHFSLFTGGDSERNISFYERLGYSITGRRLAKQQIELVIMQKANPL
ncbi:MAG: GNAT family N-acetyltransferase [Roseibium sp.]|uniref:GNAT family N-acetyltransferase n=1 Tax=Roseibium sp. TaxID=1936156 RepID=UPI0026171D12|nr:GNAT family N-acetyltransferase [Roseibium sp.]MCV0425959.1 GNAT family N-acetyltransferase [Roseibium sp.]